MAGDAGRRRGVRDHAPGAVLCARGRLGAALGLRHLSAETLQDRFHGLALGAVNFESDPEKQRINDENAARVEAELRPLMEHLQREPDGSTIASMLTTDRMRTIEEVLPSLKVIILGGMQEPGHGAGSCRDEAALRSTPATPSSSGAWEFRAPSALHVTW